jgi:hypothetical protein
LTDVPARFIALNLKMPRAYPVGRGGFTTEDDVPVLVILGGRAALEHGSAATIPQNFGTQMEFAVEEYSAAMTHSAIREDGSFRLLLRNGMHRVDLRNLSPECIFAR